MKPAQDKYQRNYYENILFKSNSNSQRNQQGLRELLSYKPGGKLLEIGCGKGEFLELAQKHFDVRGMDISDYATRHAASQHFSFIRNGDIEAENIDQNEYDAIAAFNVLEHLHNPGNALLKLFLGLRQQGVMIGSVPLNAGLIGKTLTSITNMVDRTHVSTYPPHQWRRLFQDTGFSQIQLFGEVTIGKNRNVYIRHRFWPYVSFNLMFVCIK
ncbi:MAG: class I SAM-dependent methyltransferase [Anaerolineaceae bacterium]|jgi:2-polyprenyl-3-methyl-5-hydroxy-6-metoxy-1,4-benzoquinol methylase